MIIEMYMKNCALIEESRLCLLYTSTSETDSSGGERTVETASENKTLVTSDSSNPIVIKTKEAKIKGVLVVASGASDPQIKQTLYEAVQTALQISGHQVEVYAKK